MASKRIPTFLYTLAAVAALVWLVFNYQHIVDQVVVSQFKPTTEVSQLADEIQFTEKGKFLFLAAQPELNDRADFNRHCDKKAEQTVVLGCYLGPQRLYVYNVDDPRLSGVRQVTAAHEMLHVAYDRLNYAEKKNVDKMVAAALPDVQKADQDLAERLKIYDRTEPGERNNELHSILATEAAVLPAELEEYYKQYFVNRSIITTLAAQYDQVFDEVQNQQNQLVTELDNLAAEINNLSDEYDSQSTALSNDIDQFNAQSDRIESAAEFNTARSELIDRRDVLEEKRLTINRKIQEYETKRAKLEDLNIKVKELNSKVDSTSVPNL